jgi:hypothetical protein
MPHPSFELFSQLARAGLHAASPAQRQAVRDTLLDMRVWTRALPARGCASRAGATQGCPTTLALHTSGAAAAASGREGAVLWVPFRAVLARADSEWIDATLSDGGHCHFLPHDMLLALRDLAQLGTAAVPMSPAEILLQRETIMTFVASARRYCAGHPDVRALQLATLSEPGIKSLLVGRLDAAGYPRHAAALAAMARRLFLPAWRFVLLQEGDAPASLVSELGGRRACYERRTSASRWCRLRQILARGTGAA